MKWSDPELSFFSLFFLKRSDPELSLFLGMGVEGSGAVVFVTQGGPNFTQGIDN